MNADSIHLLILMASLRFLRLCGEQACFVRVHLCLPVVEDIRG